MSDDLTLLVVDHDRQSCDFIASEVRALAPEARVVVAEHATAAVPAYRETTADIALVDFEVAMTDCRDPLAHLHRLETPAPVVGLMSGSTAAAEALATGADLFLPKPIERSQLHETILAGLELAWCERILASATAAGARETWRSTVAWRDVFSSRLRDVPFAAAVPATADGARARPAPHRVLIVDDSPDLVDVMEVAVGLHFSDVEVERAFSGFEAVERQRVRPADVVLMDLRLSDLRGEEVISNLRRAEQPPAFEILMSAAPDGAARSLLCGVDRFLPKPFPLDRLLDAIAQGLAHASRRGQAGMS